MNKVAALGELLIDFISDDVDTDLVESTTFKKLPGGAPANVCAAVSRLGGKSAFAGKVGNDSFGRFLEKVLLDFDVDTKNLVFDKVNNTTLAFVSVQSDGERDFIFNRGADGKLEISDIDLFNLLSSNVLHFGSATALLGDSLFDTYMEIFELAKKQSLFISFDPNYRTDLWKGHDAEFIASCIDCIKYSDFVKMSDEEIRLVSGKESLNDAAQEVLNMGADCVCVTLGKDGTFVKTKTFSQTVPSVKIKPVDATGAGDAFTGALLYKFSMEENPASILSDRAKLAEYISFANRVGALVCTRRGAMSALPTAEEVENM